MIEFLLSLLAVVCTAAGFYFHRNEKQKTALKQKVREQEFESKKNEIANHVTNTPLADLVTLSNARYPKKRSVRDDNAGI